MKSTTLIVLGGLLFAGTAYAADPQQANVISSDSTIGASGSKVGIDPKTGRLRPLNAVESAQLDAITAKNKQSNIKAKSAAREGVVTEVVNGRVIAYLPESAMSEVHATTAADGKLIVSHDGQSLPGAVEAANE